MIKSIVAIAIAFGFLVVGDVKASSNGPELDTCNDCTQAQVKVVAKQRYVSPVSGWKGVYVLDYHNGVAWACDVYNEPGLPQNIATCQPAAADVQQTFLEIAGYVAMLNSNVVEIPHPGGDIYKISGCPACARQWLVQNGPAVANELDFLDMLAAAGMQLSAQLGIGVAQVGASYEGQTRVKVVLSNDGSGGLEKGYCIGYLSGTELAIDANNCVDSDGNVIPTLENPNISMTYLFTSIHNHRAMINRLKGIGRPVFIRTGTTSIGPLTVECTSTECESKDPEDETDDG